MRKVYEVNSRVNEGSSKDFKIGRLVYLKPSGVKKCPLRIDDRKNDSVKIIDRVQGGYKVDYAGLVEFNILYSDIDMTVSESLDKQMDIDASLRSLAKLLKSNGFWYDEDELRDILSHKRPELELVQKASGDSYEESTSSYFGKDYKEFVKLTKKLGIAYPDEVYFD